MKHLYLIIFITLIAPHLCISAQSSQDPTSQDSTSQESKCANITKTAECEVNPLFKVFSGSKPLSELLKQSMNNKTPFATFQIPTKQYNIKCVVDQEILDQAKEKCEAIANQSMIDAKLYNSGDKVAVSLSIVPELPNKIKETIPNV